MKKLRTVYWYETDSYPEPEICEESRSERYYETTDEEFQFITRAFANWRLARKILIQKSRR